MSFASINRKRPRDGIGTSRFDQKRAFRGICACQTAAAGAHILRCDQCSHEVTAFNSCRNRHCPKCQASRREKWLEASSRELLPVPYCHIVFTLPGRLSTLAPQNPRLIYNLLFRAASETLLTIAADPRRLGARIGLLAVLHTWNQRLLHHPHLHCLVPAGGISLLPIETLDVCSRGTRNLLEIAGRDGAKCRKVDRDWD